MKNKNSFPGDNDITRNSTEIHSLSRRQFVISGTAAAAGLSMVPGQMLSKASASAGFNNVMVISGPLKALN